MRAIYWLAWVLAALAFWLSLGWFGLSAVIVDPYFDYQIDEVIVAVAPGAPSKDDVEQIQRSRSTAFKTLGVFGGVLCGFAFGVTCCRFSRARV